LIEKGDDGTSEIVLGVNANRKHLGFEDKFKKIVHDVDVAQARE
jgi:hypothetical protein